MTQDILKTQIERERHRRIGCAVMIAIPVILLAALWSWTWFIRSVATPTEPAAVYTVNVQGRDLLCVRDGGLSCNWETWNKGE